LGTSMTSARQVTRWVRILSPIRYADGVFHVQHIHLPELPRALSNCQSRSRTRDRSPRDSLSCLQWSAGGAGGQVCPQIFSLAQSRSHPAAGLAIQKGSASDRRDVAGACPQAPKPKGAPAAGSRRLRSRRDPLHLRASQVPILGGEAATMRPVESGHMPQAVIGALSIPAAWRC
jgi:hypothetical protein